MSEKSNLQTCASFKYNDKYKYLLNVIDTFLRYTWSVPLKDKTANSITTAVKSLFLNRKPIIIQSNKGIEFDITTVQRYLKHQGVNFINSQSRHKGN